jgi:hypothetical protein
VFQHQNGPSAALDKHRGFERMAYQTMHGQWGEAFANIKAVEKSRAAVTRTRGSLNDRRWAGQYPKSTRLLTAKWMLLVRRLSQCDPRRM